MAEQKNKVAVFDIDGTIFRSSLLVDVTGALIQEGVFPKKARDIYIEAFESWLNRSGSYETYIHEVVESYEEHIKGISHSDFLAVVQKVIAFRHKRVYCFTRDLVKDLKDRNYYLLAISHSPSEMVELFCENLDFDKVYGRYYEIDAEDKFTGKILYEDLISDKSKILRRALEKENLSLKGSVGVGDSEGDIELLGMVERPICFNPNKKLYEHAQANGWEVVVERKDVVYRF